MAIKGKKKSRGGQARRRPASAPRPVISAGRKAPWYKTPGGRVGLALGIAALAIAGIVLWNNARSSAEALDKRQDALDQYTGRLRTLLQTLTPPANGMQAVTAGKQGAPKGIAKDSKDWVKQLEKGASKSISIIPPPALQTSGQLFTQAVQLYLASARTFETAAQVEDVSEQRDLVLRASEVRDQANQVWATAVALLDEARKDAEMEPSSLRVPTAPSG